MFFSFRSKLFALSVVLIAAFLLVSGAYLHHTLRGWTETLIERDLEIRTHLIADAITTLESEEGIDAFLDTLRSRDAGRISLFTPEGILLADTSLEVLPSSEFLDHSDRPELIAARTEAYGRARRYSETLHQEMLYSAAFLREDGPIVRLALPLSEVDQVLSHLRLLLIIGGFFGLGVAIFMSSFASSMISKNLQKLLTRSRTRPARPAGSLQQITQELEYTLATLATERDRFRAVLDGMNEGVIATDEELQIIMTNDAATELLKYRGPLDRARLQDLFFTDTTDSTDTIDSLVRQVREGGQGSAEFDLPAPATAPPRRVHARATTRPAAGGIIIVLHDVTALRRLETIRRDFVANVSHELRTPVAIIQANAETLLDGALDSPGHARSFTEGIHRNSERLGRLVSDLLDISRIEAGQRDFDLRPLDLLSALQRALEVVLQSSDALCDRITIEVTDELRVQADSGALDQVLVNLIDNAVKYGAPNGPITVLATSRDDHIEIQITDQGPGIAEDHHHRVFERFYRVDEGRSTRMGGTGLGLSIVKHLVTSMEGEVGYRHHPDGGSIFWFTLPVAS